MAVNMNQAGFDRRITRVKQLLQDQGLEASNVSPRGYDDKNMSPLRKYLFKVDLATPALASTFPGTQPGTCNSPSEGVSVLVVKLVNPAANGANNANRVENEVAAQQLVRECLAEHGDHSLQVVAYDEFLHRSFTDIGGSVKYPTTTDILTGDFTPPKDNTDQEEWWLAKNWNDTLDYLAPSKIRGAGGIYDLLQLQDLLCQEWLSKDNYHDAYMSNPVDRKEKLRAAAEADLLKWLEAHGF